MGPQNLILYPCPPFNVQWPPRGPLGPRLGTPALILHVIFQLETISKDMTVAQYSTITWGLEIRVESEKTADSSCVVTNKAKGWSHRQFNLDKVFFYIYDSVFTGERSEGSFFSWMYRVSQKKVIIFIVNNCFRFQDTSYYFKVSNHLKKEVLHVLFDA